MRFDAGLQPERTALAWNRTALSVAVVGALAVRIAPSALGGKAVILAVLVIASGVALGAFAHRRNQRSLRVLLTGSGWLPDGRLLLMVASLLSLAAALLTAAVIQAAVAG